MLNVALFENRIIVIVVATWRDEATGKLHQHVARLPVVAIETKEVGSQIRRELIVIYDRLDDGLLISVEELLGDRTFSVRAVVCQWPQSEDESTLQPLIDEMTAQAAALEGGFDE